MKIYFLLFSVLIFILSGCNSPESVTPTPPGEFYWLVKVIDQNSQPVSNVKVSVQLPFSGPPISKCTGDDGLAVFSVDAAFDNEIIKVTLEKSQHLSSHSITVGKDMAPTEIQFTP